MFATCKSFMLSGMIVATAVASFSPLAVQAQESYGGNVVGGMAGALLGAQIGKGNGKIAAAAAGGILGALVGGNVERNNAYQTGSTTSRQQYQAPSAQVTQHSSGYQSFDAPQSQSQYQPGYDTQYQNQYGVAPYAQPVYVEPVYQQRSYVYTLPQPAYVHAQPSRTYTDDEWYYQQQQEEQRRKRDRRDWNRWDR